MSAPELVANSVIAGKYTIRSLLLHGGCMATYRALAAKNREVALKVYDPAILSLPAVTKALAQHRSIAAKLPAQHVVPIADSGTDASSGAPFTVTDFDPRPSLGQLIDRGPLTAAAMVTLIRNLARTTDLLHSSGITSLSLHPGNIFVGAGPNHDARVADFGANLVRRALPIPEKAGRWMPWLAPEQIKGQESPGQAAEIFALGLLAFFAVTGKSYWRSTLAKPVDAVALRREILAERMPVSVRAGEFSVTLNPAVDAVFARALAFRPADRYSTAQEFAARLDAALSGRVEQADAGRPPNDDVASSTVKISAGDPVADRAPSSGDAAAARRIAPPPRKMPGRTTMLGMGNMGADAPIGSQAAAGAPRPPLSTMVGIGEAPAEMPAAAPAKPAAPATAPAKPAPLKTAAPAMPTAPAKAAAPVMTNAPAPTAAPAMTKPPAKPGPPPMPVAPAATAEPPKVAPPATVVERAGPPPLPMAPPPAQIAAVLAKFEAAPPEPPPTTASLASSTATIDVAQMAPAWPTVEQGDAAADRVETDIGMVGAKLSDPPPKNTRRRWALGIGGLMVFIGGAAFALSGGAPSSRDRAASDAKVSDSNATHATAERPLAKEPAIAELPQPAETAAPPAAPPPAEDPALPIADENAVAPPAIVADTNVPHPQVASPPEGAAPRPQSKNGCGKFLKRCN
jgi:hypothetical protein